MRASVHSKSTELICQGVFNAFKMVTITRLKKKKLERARRQPQRKSRLTHAAIAPNPRQFNCGCIEVQNEKKKPFKRPHVLTLKTIETLPRCAFSIQYFPHSKANGAKHTKKTTQLLPGDLLVFSSFLIVWNSAPHAPRKSRDPPPAGAAARHSASLICNKAFVFHYLCDVIRRCGGGKLLFTQKCQRRGELSDSDPR